MSDNKYTYRIVTIDGRYCNIGEGLNIVYSDTPIDISGAAVEATKYDMSQHTDWMDKQGEENIFKHSGGYVLTGDLARLVNIAMLSMLILSEYLYLEIIDNETWTKKVTIVKFLIGNARTCHSQKGAGNFVHIINYIKKSTSDWGATKWDGAR